MRGGTATSESHNINDIVLEWRTHWRTGLAAFLGMGLGGSIGPTVFSLFIKPLEDAFGWSRGEIGLAHMASVAAAISAPFLGRIIDRKGTRGPLLISFMALGLFWLLLAAMPGPIIFYYLFFTGLTIVGLPSTGLGYARAISAVFEKSRGFSLAVTRAGMAVSAIILPGFLYGVIADYGWRGGYVAMAGLALLVGLPIAWAGIERSKNEPIKAGRDSSKPPVPALHFFKNKTVLLIALATGLAYAPLIAIVSQAQPLLLSKGLDGQTAASLVGLFGASSVIGAFVTGYFLDRIWAPAVAMVVMLVGAAGAVILAVLPGTIPIAAAGVLLVGFAMGAETDISAFMVARYCGVANFSSVYGIVILAVSLASSIGSSGIGFMYDAYGDYAIALMTATACFVLAGLGYIALGRYPVQPSD
jgi:predicted MFS family arabinose efflux permease